MAELDLHRVLAEAFSHLEVQAHLLRCAGAQIALWKALQKGLDPGSPAGQQRHHTVDQFLADALSHAFEFQAEAFGERVECEFVDPHAGLFHPEEHWRQREIDRLVDHYIVCGAGRVGRSAARELARRPAPFVIIESNEAKAQKYAAENWLTLIGDATQEQTLREAQIEHARGLVAATTTDATNLYIVLTARDLNPKLRIIARASEEMAEKHLLKAGADSVVSPYAFAGQRIAQSFLRPHVVSFLDTATTHLGIDLEIGEVPISLQSVFAGQTIESSRIRQDRGVIILAIKRAAGMHFNPAPDDRIEAGDFLIAMGEPDGLRRLEQSAERS